MANNTRARRQARLSRSLGIALTPKAAKYLERRPYGPGEHGRARKKQDSDYAVRLREKQRLRAQYGIREAQMTRAFEEAKHTKGMTGENLVEILESRLDALVLRAGFARTTAQARQLVRHGHFTVNGQAINIPSYLVRPGDVVQLIPESRNIANIQLAWNLAESSRQAAWINRNNEDFSAKFERLPTVEEINIPVKEDLIVELYSR